MITADPYYFKKEVSNSDLSSLKNYFSGIEQNDLTEAFKFGNLIDAMITEPEKVDFLNCRIGEVQFNGDDFFTAKQMKKSFLSDPSLKSLLDHSEGQKTFVKKGLVIRNEDLQCSFQLDTRCKYDLWIPSSGFGIDIKSTKAKTMKQFLLSFSLFDYDRSRSFYIDTAETDRDLVIGIGKEKPYPIFKVFIKRGDSIYQEGLKKYQDLSFRWFQLFGDPDSLRFDFQINSNQ